jgi:hypothetical protein
MINEQSYKRPLPTRGSQFSHLMRGIQQAAQSSSGFASVESVKMRVCFCQPPSTERIRKSHLRLYANLDQSEFDKTSQSFSNIRVTTPFCSTPTDNGQLSTAFFLSFHFREIHCAVIKRALPTPIEFSHHLFRGKYHLSHQLFGFV